MDNLRAEIQHSKNLYRRELDWMRRQPQARGHKAKYREDAFYELEKVAKQRIEAVGRAVRAGNQADAPVPEVGERLLRLKIDGGLLVDGRRNRAGDPPRRDANGLAAFGKRPSIDDEIDGTRQDDRHAAGD